MTGEALDVSVLILTLNEERNLPRCLGALSWCDDVVVLDSGSTDRTMDVARQTGARVFDRKFDDFAGQRNFGLESIAFGHRWVLHIDADEVVTPELVAAMEHALANTSYIAFRMPSKTIFQGRWLKHAGMYPVYQVRLTKVGSFRFRQVGHGQKEDASADSIGMIGEPYLHFAFSKGLHDWFDKHNRYSTQEAKHSLELRAMPLDWAGLVSLNPYRRREALRRASTRLPMRPLLRFVYVYFLRFGFLDGLPGLVYASLLTQYEFMIAAKTRELLVERPMTD